MAERANPQAPLLMWHHVGEAPTRELRPYAVTRDLLTAQLDALADAGYEAVTFEDLRQGRCPPRPVVLTFDDGYASFLEQASPELLARGMRAVVFVVAGSLGGVNDWDRGASGLSLLDADGVWEVADQGHEVAVHAWRHRPMVEVASEVLERELLAARAVLEELSGWPVRSLSYPHGRADPRVVGLVQRCGFDLACLDCRPPDPAWPAHLGLSRVCVEATTAPATLVEMSAAGAVEVAPPRSTPVDALGSLVEHTLAAAEGRSGAEAWGVVHAVAAPLAEALHARGVPPQREVFAATAACTAPDAAALGRALQPLAKSLDRQLDAKRPVPVWDVATPDEAGAVELDAIRLAPPLSDVARLCWRLEAPDHLEAMAAYLRGTGLRHGRRAARRGLEDLRLAETALLAREALEEGAAANWGHTEAALRSVRAGEGARAAGAEVGMAPGQRLGRLATALTALVRQDLREHYGGSLLGIGWAVVAPLSTFAVLAVFFGRVVRIDVPDYPQFLLTGLVPWLFVARAIGQAAGSVRGRGSLLRLAAFPRIVLPLATATSALVDLVGQLVVVCSILALHPGLPGLRLLALPVVLAATVALGLAGAVLAAGLAVRYRDVAHLVPLLLSLGFYTVPVVYPVTLVPEDWRALYRLNPAAVLVEAFRSTLLGGPWPPAWAMAGAAFSVGAGLAIALRWFGRASDRFVAEA